MGDDDNQEIIALDFCFKNLESIKSFEEDFLRVICIFNEISTIPWFILYYFLARNSSVIEER